MPLGKVGRVQSAVRRNNADAKTQPLTQLYYGEAHDEEIKGRPETLLGRPRIPKIWWKRKELLGIANKAQPTPSRCDHSSPLLPKRP